MPRKGKKLRRQAAPQGLPVEIATAMTLPQSAAVMGRETMVLTIATSTSSIGSALSPSLFSRTTAMANLFQSYRFDFLRITVHPMNSGGAHANYVSLAYIPEETKTATNYAANDLSQLSSAVSFTPYLTTNTGLVLRRPQLLGNAAFKWYDCGSVNSNTFPANQGQIAVARDTAGANTDSIYFTVEYRCRFTGARDSAV